MWALNYALYWLVVVGTGVVFYKILRTIRRVRKPIKPLQLEDLSALLVIEHFYEGYTTETTKQMHSDSLVAGDAVLAKLSDSVRQTLSAPISDKFRSWFSEGDTAERLTPERVRAAKAIVEVQMILESLIRMFRSNLTAKLFITLNERQGALNLEHSQVSTGYVISKIASKIEIDGDWRYAEDYEKEFNGFFAACRIWDAIVALLREGKVHIPGLRAKEALILPKIIANEKS